MGTPVPAGPPALCSTPARKEERKLGGISPASSTPRLRFPIVCVSAFHLQTYDYKGVKQEGPFTKPGGTHELRVGVMAQAGGRQGTLETRAPQPQPGRVPCWHLWLCPRARGFTPCAAFCFILTLHFE